MFFAIHHKNYFRFLFLFLFLIQNAWAIDWQDRRRDQFGNDFSYFVYPIAGEIPGLGSAAGLGGTILNINDSDLDFTGFKIEGDFDASGYTFLDYHLIEERLIFDIGYYDYLVAPIAYDRGIDSDKDDYILPKAEGAYLLGQLTLSFLDRHFETYFRYGTGHQKLLEVLDKDEDEFAAVDDEKKDGYQYSLGFNLDNTDDRLDPRSGYRFEMSLNASSNDDSLRSGYFIADYNLTGYMPFRQFDTLAINLFRSDAHVTDRVDADFATLQAERGLGCSNLSPGPEQDKCFTAETKFINQLIAENRHGTATPMGGTQRLRSFANNRFYAGHSMFYGVEYRWNLFDERVPFDYKVARGIRTGMQIAFFIEQGSVADSTSDLFDTLKTSYGAGFRLVLSGVIIRADISTGDEGEEFTLFINYPWSMFSVDS